MKIEQIVDTYDSGYAAEYDDTFLHDGWTKASTEFQIDLIKGHLRGSRNWLDVACGTGYVLSRFPSVDRAGLDISPAMLDKARERNPGVEFVQRDYREAAPDWNDRWDLVTCMWWAYSFCETMTSLSQLIGRLADWTSPNGTCLLPLCNPQKFDRHNVRLPYIDAKVPGRCMITGITWAWIQENGKRHIDMLAPQPEHLMAMFRMHFDDVSIAEGPLDVIGEGWRVQDVLTARGKKRHRPEGDMYPPADIDRAGRLEWLLTTGPGVLAGLDYPSKDLKHVRVTAFPGSAKTPQDVVAQKIGYRVERGVAYKLSFEARTDGKARIGLGLSMWHEPWSNLGLDATIDIGSTWRPFEMTVRAAADSDNARLFLNLGASQSPIDVQDLTFRRVDPR